MKGLLKLLLLTVMLSCAAKELPTVINIDQNKIELKCSHQTTKAELEDAKQKIKSLLDMDLSYEGSQFDDGGTVALINVILSQDGEKTC